MLPYGHNKADTLCPYGCCAGKYHRKRNARTVNDRAKRKTARQNARKEAIRELGVDVMEDL